MNLILMFLAVQWEPPVQPITTPYPVHLGSNRISMVSEWNGYRFFVGVRQYDTRDVFFVYKPPGGAWSPLIKPYIKSGYPEDFPGLVIDENGTAYIFFHRDQYEGHGDSSGWSVFYSYSIGSYNDFSNAINIMGSPDTSNEFFPSAVKDANNTFHIAFQSDEPGNFDIFYASFQPPGVPTVENISSTPDDSWYPVVLERNGEPVVIWSEYRDGGPPLLYLRFKKNGIWQSSKALSPFPGENTHYASGVIVQNALFLFFVKSDYLYALLYDLNSETIMDTQRIFTSPPSAFEPIACVDSSGGINLFFSAGDGEETEIYYTRSPSSFLSFSSPERVTYHSGLSIRPQPIYRASTGELEVWFEDTGISELTQIFTMRKTIGNLKPADSPKNLTFILKGGTFTPPASLTKRGKISIYSSEGRHISTFSIAPALKYKLKLKPGVYFFKIENINGKLILL